MIHGDDHSTNQGRGQPADKPAPARRPKKPGADALDSGADAAKGKARTPASTRPKRTGIKTAQTGDAAADGAKPARAKSRTAAQAAQDTEVKAKRTRAKKTSEPASSPGADRSAVPHSATKPRARSKPPKAPVAAMAPVVSAEAGASAPTIACLPEGGWPPGYEPRPPQLEMHRGMEANRFSVVVAHRRMGKTVAVLNHLIRQAGLCTRPRPFYAYVAPFTHQAKAVAWGYLKAYTAHIEDRRARETELAIELPNEAKIRLFGADNPDSLRGLYFDGVVLDEFAMMKPEAWLSVIRPALSDRSGFAVFIGTPAGHNAFYDVYRAALADTSWYAATFTAASTGVLPEGELESAKKQMSEARFRQEYLCDFEVSCEDTLIPLTLLGEALDRRVSYQGLPVVMGVDVGLSLGGDPTAIVAHRGGKVIACEEFRLDETMAVAGRVREAAGRLSPALIAVDAIGWGAGVAHALSGWGLPVACVNVAESPAEKDRFERLRDELWWRAREFFAGRTTAIDPGIELSGKLVAELATPSYRYTPEGRIKIESKQELKHRGQASPNLADAFALTLVADHLVNAQPVLHTETADKRSRVL